MRISIQHETSAGALLAAARRVGPRRTLEARVRRDSHDYEAKLALHDLREYADTDPAESVQAERWIILRDDRLDRLTLRRLELLMRLSALGGSAHGVRRLAAAAGRDVKNVSLDIKALASIGLVLVTRAGRGKAATISLPGHRISIHLVEPPATVRAPTQRRRASV